MHRVHTKNVTLGRGSTAQKSSPQKKALTCIPHCAHPALRSALVLVTFAALIIDVIGYSVAMQWHGLFDSYVSAFKSIS
jgi:hypothetical protein